MHDPSDTDSLREEVTPQAPAWSVAVFAHNVAKTITDCLDNVLSQASGQSIQVFVLVNGSRDETELLVRKYSATHSNVEPVVLPIADKANSWNHYIHVIKPKGAVHFFVDGDVHILPNSFQALSRGLSSNPGSNAAGALPATGRSQVSWSQNMLRFGRLAGGLYALKSRFISDLRRRQVRIPVGLIGEDLFLSCVVKEKLSLQGLIEPSDKLIFAPDARFTFRPLSPVRPKDWWAYGCRLVRYQIRDYQLGLLLRDLQNHPRIDLPHDMPELYCKLRGLPRYRWRGRMTAFDILAVMQLRRVIRKSMTSRMTLTE